jgi:hypothetical protein
MSLLALLAGCMGTQQPGGQVEGRALNSPTVGEVAEFLKSKGHNPKIQRDDAGSPMLVVNEEGDNFMLAFYDCSKGGGLATRRCTGAEFSVAYPVKKKPTLSRINELNQSYRMAKVYVNSEGNPGVSLAVNLGGAFSSGNLSDNLEWWVAAMRHFEEDIGWN